RNERFLVERNGEPIAELTPPGPQLVGVHRDNSSQRRAQREAFVEAVFASFPVIPFDLRSARVHAGIGVAMSSAGRPIGVHDLIISATALAHGYDVLTDNPRKFDRVPGLIVRRPAW
ncbi:MAG: tRNA(fMet)-specific endonuclease VapC, partial [Thermomicrobiales bacterium]|nr:tRNA(fMet)-specific endonuclease VapC [Thermomicrobiales bacterium]